MAESKPKGSRELQGIIGPVSGDNYTIVAQKNNVLRVKRLTPKRSRKNGK